jgi:hypothetical protein
MQNFQKNDCIQKLVRKCMLIKSLMQLGGEYQRAKLGPVDFEARISMMLSVTNYILPYSVDYIGCQGCTHCYRTVKR